MSSTNNEPTSQPDLPETMRAVTVAEPGDPEVLSLGEAPTPQPAAGEVLIRTTAAGINRADVMQRKGHYPPPPGASEIIGLEVSGTIAALGEGVSDWQLGDECIALLAGGGYAEFVAVDARQVLPPPPGIDLVTAAGVVEVAATVVSNMDVAHLADGERFLVHGGAGGIGSFAIQYAKARGCRVLTTAGSEAKLDYCRELGADLALDYHEEWVDAVTEDGGVDVILDNQGARYLMPNVNSLRPDGRVVIIGLQGGRKAELNLGALLPKRGQVISTSLRSRPVEQKAAVCRSVREQVWPMYADGRIKPAPTKVFDAADIVAAHEYFDSGEHRGKLVLRF